MKFGEEFSTKYDMGKLKVLGTVGEPINPEAWHWYHKFVGHENASIVDTYWQVGTPQKTGFISKFNHLAPKVGKARDGRGRGWGQVLLIKRKKVVGS